MFKKLLLSLMAFLVIFQSSVVPAYAQDEQWYDSNIKHWFIKVYDTGTSEPQLIFGERYTAAQVQWVIYSLIVLPLNMLFSSEFTACWLDKIGTSASMTPCFAVPGFVNFLEKLIDAVSDFTGTNINTDPALASSTKLQKTLSLLSEERPISGIAYFKELASKVTLTPTAHAQEGFGYGALSILRPLWSKTRNMAYGLLVFATIIMSFMIMFRTKIGPQTVITVQSAIPRLIGAIILISFSYAIAGLMIDLMYVVIALVANVLTSGGDPEPVYKLMIDGPGGGGIFGMMMGYTFLFVMMLLVALVSSFQGVSALLLATPLGAIALIIGLVVLLAILVFTYFKIIGMLVRTLVSVYLLVIFSPFYIMGGAVTSALSVGNWLKDLAANLAVFPAVGIFFFFALLFLKSAGDVALSQLPGNIQQLLNRFFTSTGIDPLIAPNGNVGWAPPLLGIGESAGALMILFVSLGIVMLIPKIADIIKGFMSGRPLAYGSAIGEIVTGAAVAGSALAGAPGKIYSAVSGRQGGLVTAIRERMGNKK